MCCCVSWEKQGLRFSNVTLCARKCLTSAPYVYSLFERNRKLLVLVVVVDFEDSDWLAWLYPSPYSAAHSFGIVIMGLDSIFIQVDVLFFLKRCVLNVCGKRRGGNISFSKYLAMCKCGHSLILTL